VGFLGCFQRLLGIVHALYDIGRINVLLPTIKGMQNSLFNDLFVLISHNNLTRINAFCRPFDSGKSIRVGNLQQKMTGCPTMKKGIPSALVII
jgi:hypothetical protein